MNFKSNYLIARQENYCQQIFSERLERVWYYIENYVWKKIWKLKISILHILTLFRILENFFKTRTIICNKLVNRWNSTKNCKSKEIETKVFISTEPIIKFIFVETTHHLHEIWIYKISNILYWSALKFINNWPIEKFFLNFA